MNCCLYVTTTKADIGPRCQLHVTSSLFHSMFLVGSLVFSAILVEACIHTVLEQKTKHTFLFEILMKIVQSATARVVDKRV